MLAGGMLLPVGLALAGVLGSTLGLPATAWVLAALAAVAVALAALAWPAPDQSRVPGPQRKRPPRFAAG